MYSEEHFTGSQTVRDIVIGMSDGLTVPFALTAGLSGAVDSNTIIVTAGIAEIVAGAIAMGLGGYLAGNTEYQHYFAEKKREEREVELLPEREMDEVVEVLTAYGVSSELSKQVAVDLSKDKDAWVNFMMKFELNLDEPNPRDARKSALTIGLAYVIGGLLPLLGYIFTSSSSRGLLVSSILTLSALLCFGYIKSKIIGQKPFEGAIKTLLIGLTASAIAFFVAKLFAA